MIAMPGPRLEIAQLFVHAIELGECFGDQAGGAAMIGKQVMTDPVTAGAPQELVAIEAEIITGGLQVTPVAQFECRMKMAVRAGLHEIDGVMIRSTAQEREKVRHPI